MFLDSHVCDSDNILEQDNVCYNNNIVNLEDTMYHSHVCYNDNILKLEDIMGTVAQNILCPQDCLTVLV